MKTIYEFQSLGMSTMAVTLDEAKSYWLDDLYFKGTGDFYWPIRRIDLTAAGATLTCYDASGQAQFQRTIDIAGRWFTNPNGGLYAAYVVPTTCATLGPAEESKPDTKQDIMNITRGFCR